MNLPLKKEERWIPVGRDRGKRVPGGGSAQHWKPHVPPPALPYLGDFIWASVVFLFLFKDSAEIIIPTAFSRSDHILPPTEDLLQEVPHVSHCNIPPKTSGARVSRGGTSSVFRRPFCQSPSFLPLVPAHTAVPECVDAATRRRRHRQPSSASLTAGLTQITLCFH